MHRFYYDGVQKEVFGLFLGVLKITRNLTHTRAYPHQRRCTVVLHAS
jgi:hypothetical protein